MLANYYKDKKVFITGITGFKGAWLALLLHKMGAKVSGLGLHQFNRNTIYHEGKVSSIADVYIADLNEEFSDSLEEEIKSSDYIFHLAAQPIVSEGYKNPYYTFNTNLMGTLKLLELVKNPDKEIKFLNVASDRIYLSVEHAHKETDIMGGKDPYSLSKVFSNMLGDLYNEMDGLNGNLKIINGRASNILGGGDRGANRILTSIIEANENKTPLQLRNPEFVRPYIYVLDSLCQYLVLMAKDTEYTAYNIGASSKTSVSVQELVDSCKRYYPDLIVEHSGEKFGFEGNTLLVDNSRYYNEFTKSIPIADTIDELVDRIMEYNLNVNKDIAINKLLDEAILQYSEVI